MKTKQSVEISSELVRRAQNGDPAAFSELYQKSAGLIYRSIASMTKDEDTAWDIHQNTYIRAWQGLKKLEKPEAFLPWLRRIAVNETVKELTKERPLFFTDLADEDGEEPQFEETRDGYQPEIELDKREAARLVRELLEKLPQRRKLIIGMYYYEGCSVREIAEALSVTQGTVKAQLHLGRKQVETEARRLEREGVKLFGLSPMVFLRYLLQNQELSLPKGEKAMGAVLTKTAATAGDPVMLTAKSVGGGFLHSLPGKAAAVVLVAAAAVGGVLGYQALRDRVIPGPGDYRPTVPAEITESAFVSSKPIPVSSEEEETAGPIASQTMFSWSACDFDDSILAAVCSAPFPEEAPAPTVVWNEGAQEDRLLICPRYAGSTVSASRILYHADGKGTVEENPTYSAVCGEGDCVGAALERPEEGPAWVVTVRTPEGLEAGWVLAHNSAYGTPSCEYLIVSEPAEEEYREYPEEPCLIAGHVLKQIGYRSASGYGGISAALAEDESSPFYALGNGLVLSARRAAAESEANPEYLFINDAYDWGDAAAWTIRECRMEGDTCRLDAAIVHEMYMTGLFLGEDAPHNPYGDSVAGKVKWQAEQFAELRMLGHAGRMAEEGEALRFELHGLLVYNLTLAAKTVSVGVNGQDAGLFPLREGDFFTWIPLEYLNLPGDEPVRVEARVTETCFGAPERAILDLWPDLGSNLGGGR